MTTGQKSFSRLGAFDFGLFAAIGEKFFAEFFGQEFHERPPWIEDGAAAMRQLRDIVEPVRVERSVGTAGVVLAAFAGADEDAAVRACRGLRDLHVEIIRRAE